MSKRPTWWLDFLKKFWPILGITARAVQLPVVGKFVALVTAPIFSKKNFNITYIPINKNIEGTGNTFLPQTVVEALIRRSAHRVILNRCSCRDSKGCENYPVEYACTLLGEGSKEVDPRIAKHVSIDEAISHMNQKIKEGLIPMTGRVKMDNYFYGVRDKGKLLTICYCCRCCCTILDTVKYLPQDVADSLVRLKGLRISIDNSICDICGICVDECFINAISIDSGNIIHDMSLCKGCGKCISACPKEAIKAEIDNVDEAIEELTGRIERFVQVD